MSEKLKPCFKCGNENIKCFESYIWSEKGRYVIYCEICDVGLNQLYPSKEDAIQAWNKRAEKSK